MSGGDVRGAAMAVENVAAHKGCGTASRASQRNSRHSLCHAGA